MHRRRAIVTAVVAGGLALGLAACGGTATPSDAPAIEAPSSAAPTPPTAPPGAAPTAPGARSAPGTSSAPASLPPPSSVPPASLAPTSEAPAPSLSIPSLPSFTARGPAVGGDVSWPQCPKGMGIPQKRSQGAPMPLGSAEFVILGLTNGPGFVANPCLADQLAWARQRHLLVSAYSVISAPYGDVLARYGGTGPYDAGTASGRLANVGYQEALFNVATMRAAGLETPFVWLDIEPVGDFEWPEGKARDTRANAAVVKGAARGYADQGYDVGVYSIGSLWKRVVGDLRLGLPEWRPAGGGSRADAVRRCAGDWMFQGGAAVLAQWVERGRDRDVTCPGQAAYLSLWFHQY